MLVKFRDACKELNVSERLLRRLTDEQRIPVYRIGRTVRFDLNELKASVKQPVTNETPTE